MISDQSLQHLRNDSSFTDFTKWVKSLVDELNSVDGIEKMSNEEVGEEARVRLKTVAKLKEILSPVISFREKREPTVDEIQASKKKHGL